MFVLCSGGHKGSSPSSARSKKYSSHDLGDSSYSLRGGVAFADGNGGVHRKGSRGSGGSTRTRRSSHARKSSN